MVAFGADGGPFGLAVGTVLVFAGGVQTEITGFVEPETLLAFIADSCTAIAFATTIYLTARASVSVSFQFES